MLNRHRDRGNFTLSTFLPLEFAKAYGVISSANASLLPTLQFDVNRVRIVFGSAPTLTPTFRSSLTRTSTGCRRLTVEPPGRRRHQQWSSTTANPTMVRRVPTKMHCRSVATLSTIIGEACGTSNGFGWISVPGGGNRCGSGRTVCR